MFSSVIEARKTIDNLKDVLQRDDGCSDFEVFSLIDALKQVFDIVAAVNKKDRVLTTEEISDVGEQGMLLVDNLIYKLMTKDLDNHKQEVEQLALYLANWVIKHKGELSNIQSVVDALANMANQVEDKVSLLQLSTFMDQVANACSDMIRYDLDNTDPSRPWLALNMNRGIVATRTHDIELMRAVFDDVIKAIPLEAPTFFKEGMSEMERLDYPKSVREVMQEYFDRAQLPVKH